jgi:Uma2 family endonuclease
MVGAAASVSQATRSQIFADSIPRQKWLLGLLIDRKNCKVHIYRPNCALEILENPEVVSCDPELAGFGLKMAKIW